MNIAYFVAKRYFKSTKSLKLVHILTKIATIGMIIGNTSLIVSSSIYNGLSEMVTSILKSTDADIVVKPNDSSNANFTEIKNILKSVCGAGSQVYTILEGYAIAQNNANSVIIKLRGIDDFGLYLKKIENFIPYKIKDSNFLTKNCAIIGDGVAASITINQPYQKIEIFTLNNQNFLSPFKLSKSFNIKSIALGGIFSIDTQKDRLYIFTNLEFAKQLFKNAFCDNFFEIELDNKCNKQKIIENLTQLLKNYNCTVQSFQENQSAMISAIKMEQKFTKIIFFSLLAISAINVFFCINSIFLAKRDDINLLAILGLRNNGRRKIFFFISSLIATKVAVLSSIISFIILIIQKKFNLVKMGASIGSIDAYPVKIQLSDFILFNSILFAIVITTSFFSLRSKT